MKRIKIMLMSLTLLAIVGGALAFKAKFTPEKMCTTTTTSITGTFTACPNLDFWAKTANGTTTYYTTAPDPQLDCSYRDGLVLKPITCATTSIPLSAAE